MIISITGDEGSGKSTVAKMLAKKLKMKHYYVGGLRRQMAKERGMTLSEFNKLGEKEDFTDKEVDNWQKKLGKEEDNFIIEGRTSYHFIPHSIKIYLGVNEKEGAKRIWSDLKSGSNRNEDANLNNFNDVLKSIRERRMSDIKRYKKIFNLDAFNKKNFDLVLDSTNKSIEAVYQEIYHYLTSL